MARVKPRRFTSSLISFLLYHNDDISQVITFFEKLICNIELFKCTKKKRKKEKKPKKQTTKLTFALTLGSEAVYKTR